MLWRSLTWPVTRRDDLAERENAWVLQRERNAKVERQRLLDEYR